jgi:hypothetical protein
MLASKTLLIQRFREIERRYRRPWRGRSTPEERALYTRSQTDLYHLAQAIATREVQLRLDRVRREIMVLVRAGIRSGGAAVIKPHKMQRPVRWSEIMLTPEVEVDIRVSGVNVPLSLAQELRTAHALQVHDVRRKVGI